MLVPRRLRRTTLAAVTAVGLTAVAALPAGAAGSTAAHGKASSTLTILRVSLLGTTVKAGELAAVANDTAPHVAQLVLTPLDSSLTGPVGRQTITPADGSTVVPATPKNISVPSTGTALLSLTGPTFAAKAVDNATQVLATAGLNALGTVNLLTVPLDLGAASLTDIAKVTSTGASAEKALTLGKLALPSLQDLLASLGVDLDALLDQLTQGKLTQLNELVGGALTSLNSAVDNAQSVLTGEGQQAANTLAGAQQQLSTATTDLGAANTAFNAAWSSAYGALLAPAKTLLDAALSTAGLSSTVTADQFDSASAPVLTAISAAFGAATVSNLTSLASAVVDVEGVVADVNALVDALQALIDQVLSTVLGSDDPLASLGSIKVVTSAVAKRNPVANADVSVGSVHVLGDLVPLGSLTSALGSVTDTLSSVLESVAGVSFTAPTISVGSPAETTDQQGRTRFANASITGVTLGLPSITLPAALRLAGVPQQVTGSVRLGELADSAQWTPATTAASTPTSTGTPGTPSTPSSGGSLPDTGGHLLVPLAGLLAIGAALVLRRRLSAAA